MAAFKGVSTFQDYEECLKKGLCEEHSKEFYQDEYAALKDEFPRKAFHYIRINIVYPLLFKKSPKCEKIKLLMQRTPALSKILRGGDIADGADTIFILDSVITFTLCQLSQICCVGALFHIRKKECDDPKLKSLRALLLIDQLDKNIVQYLYPILQKNFAGYDSDIIKASHIITLIFVRNFCTRFTMKTAIEHVEKDFKGEDGWENFKSMADEYYQKERYEEATRSYVSALCQNLYSAELYTQLADSFLNIQNFKAGQLYAYFAISLKPNASEAYCQFITSLILQEHYQAAVQMTRYALDICDKMDHFYSTLKLLCKEAESMYKNESAISKFKNSVKSSDSFDKKLSGENCQSASVKLIDSDSDSAESEDESEMSKKSAELVDADDSDESETVEKKPAVTVEIRKNKLLGTKKKRTISEVMSEAQVEEEMDVNKINSYLKEASEALLADCGYKAVQIFRGPLRNFIESSKLQSFEECDIVCIKYSYGIAYCKSGGFDDLQKCIMILKDIIENHDSITFPAAHYSLGLAYRKLNRFKESLNYLEIVESFLCKGIHFKVYPWPGMTTVIQETKPDVLKTLVQDLIKECENPPNPDAYCRYAFCDYQPTIYYTDPDFKGYISLSCSEQCCMQYHFLCWKTMKAEKNLTDKEFLEKACFTPDCEGVIVKIQNIDKKGDLSKEFTSDFKKHSKQKWSKLEKKTDLKDKKRKKVNCKSEEISNGSEKGNSNAEDISPQPTQLPGLHSSNEETNKSDNNEKSVKIEEVAKVSVKIEEVTKVSVDSQNDVSDIPPESSTQEFSNASCIAESNKELSKAKQAEENEQFYLNECIKNNVYSYMDDFLQHHGPLKVDDPLLVDEIASFPEEVHVIITEYGGIGEFLKDDLRFAYVGDLYVCVVSDLATAYKMCSSSCLGADFKSLQSLGHTSNTRYYNNSDTPNGHQNTALNPDAVEYTPSGITKNSHYKFVSSNSLSQGLNSDSPPFVPAEFEPPSKYCNEVCHTSASSLSTFPDAEMHVSKSKSCEAVLSRKNQNGPESVSSMFCDNPEMSECTYQQRMSSESPDSDSKITDNTIVSAGIRTSKNDNLEFQLLTLLKLYCSEEIVSRRQKIDSYIKPFVIRKQTDLASSGTMTDNELPGGDSSAVDTKVLSEENLLLRNELEIATQEQQQLGAELARLQKRLKEMEVQEKEYENKEQERLLFLESLTDAQVTIDEQKKDLISLTSEKNSLQKSVENLTLALEKVEEKMKNALDAKEKQFNATVQNLQNEKDELKNRAKIAELHVLHFKKTEYLKKIEEKSAEAAKRRKELTDGLSIVSPNLNLNPVVQNNMKALSTQLLSYINNLNTIKLDFMRKIDEEIEKVKNGTPLKETKELEMKELPEIPCWKNTFPANGPSTEKSAFNPMQMPFNFNMNTAAPLQVPPASFKSSFTVDVPAISTAQVPAAKLISAPAAIVPPAATIVPPSAVKPIGSFKKELSNGAINFDLNSQIEESFKSAMASINSYASTPCSTLPLDDEFQKNCVVFKHPDPVPASISKVPPGIQTPLIHAASGRKITKNLIPESAAESLSSIKEKSLDTLDTVPLVKPEPARSTVDLEKKKTAPSKNNYEKLLNKLKEHFPQYTKEELIPFVIEFRAQRKGRLSGLHFDTIISEISNLIMESIMSKKKATEPKALPKSTKVLVNKKLVPDPKPVISEQQQGVKKKTAWGTVDTDSNRRFSGSADDDCIICCDPMTDTSAYKVSCGHIFHETCIRQWLKTKSNCPVCRVLLLLPEEYPSLS